MWRKQQQQKSTHGKWYGREKNEQKYNQSLRGKERGKGIDIASDGDRARDELKFQSSRDFLFVPFCLEEIVFYNSLSLTHTYSLSFGGNLSSRHHLVESSPRILRCLDYQGRRIYPGWMILPEWRHDVFSNRFNTPWEVWNGEREGERESECVCVGHLLTRISGNVTDLRGFGNLWRGSSGNPASSCVWSDVWTGWELVEHLPTIVRSFD